MLGSDTLEICKGDEDEQQGRRMRKEMHPSEKFEVYTFKKRIHVHTCAYRFTIQKYTAVYRDCASLYTVVHICIEILYTHVSTCIRFLSVYTSNFSLGGDAEHRLDMMRLITGSKRRAARS